MQALLEDLPGLFEDKFRQRLQPMLDQQQRLLSDNANLRRHLLQLQPGSDTGAQRLLLPPARACQTKTAPGPTPCLRLQP